MPGSDFLQLRREDAPQRGITDWLTAQLRTAIADGRLTGGTRLPPSRQLAADLGVARGVVVAAYERLVEEGHALARTRAGTVIRERATAVGPTHSTTTTRADATTFKQPGPPASNIRFDLNPGLPDLRDFPRAAWLRHERAALEQASPVGLGYGDPRGHHELREQLAAWLTRTRGLRVEPNRIIVLGGVAQALALLSQWLVNQRKPVVAVEDPGSAGAVIAMQHWGIQCIPVPVDQSGMDVRALSASGATSAVVTPAHQFPTGVVLGPARRAALVEWAHEGRLIIEDDYDADQRYDRTPVAAVQPLAPESVAYTGSTSKSLAPGLRLGWLIPPAEMFDDLVESKRASDLGEPALPQLVLARMIESGDYDRHLRRQRNRQRARRDTLIDALRARLPDARIGGVAAGLHVQVTFEQHGLDDVDLAERVGNRGVRLQPLSWHRHTPGSPGVVIGYGGLSARQLVEAIDIVAQEVRSLGADR